MDNLKEYLGIYDDDFEEVLCIKIMAKNHSDAFFRFKQELNRRNYCYHEIELKIIPLFDLDVISGE